LNDRLKQTETDSGAGVRDNLPTCGPERIAPMMTATHTTTAPCQIHRIAAAITAERSKMPAPMG
jgi:hypothetical protein